MAYVIGGGHEQHKVSGQANVVGNNGQGKKNFLRGRRVIVTCLLALAAGASLVWLATPDVSPLAQGFVQVTQWQKQRGRAEVRIGPGSPDWVDFSQISLHLIHAVVAAEDNRFFSHHGIDWVAIEESLRFNFEEQRYARGASTITQQVIKLALLSPEKSLWRKFREALGALRLEEYLDKEQILAWYLNLADFGGGIYGVRKAAEFYFQTSPSLLTIKESIHLALVLPSPNAWSIGLKKKKLTPFGRQRFSWIARQMLSQRFITETLFAQTLATGDFGEPIQSDPEHEKDHLEFVDSESREPGNGD